MKVLMQHTYSCMVSQIHLRSQISYVYQNSTDDIQEVTITALSLPMTLRGNKTNHDRCHACQPMRKLSMNASHYENTPIQIY